MKAQQSSKIQELQVDLKAKNKLIDKMKEDAANDFSQNQALSAAVQHHKSLACVQQPPVTMLSSDAERRCQQRIV